VKGIRKDVKVVNLSLLNTGLYMKQLKKAGVPFNFSEKQMDNLLPFRTKDGRIFNINTLGVRDIIAANAGYGLEMILEPDSTFNQKIFTNYKEKYPIYFAVTVSEDNLMGIQPHLKLEGLAFRVVPEIANKAPDIERTQKNLHQVYSYTGLFDPKVYKDDNTMKLISNYASAFWQVGRALRQKGDLEGAIREFEEAKRISPDEPANLNWLGVTYAELGKFDEAIKNLRDLVRLEPQNPICYAQLAAVLQNAGQLDEAISWLEKSIEVNPNFAEGYGRLFNLHLIMGDTLKAISTLEEWVARHPSDTRTKANLEQLRRELAKGDTTKILGKYRILEIGH